MDRRLRYEALPTSEDGVSFDEAAVSRPPEYSPQSPAALVADTATPPPSFASSVQEEPRYHPPPYSDTLELPTYDECMRAKQLEDAERREAADVASAQEPIEMTRETRQKFENVIGTDAMFILGFILSFLFNWIGLLAAFCLMHTCAGRFGALTGFGLSLVKWVTIAKRNNWMVGMSDENAWIWWLLLSFGILISCSGAMQYLRLKYVWSRAQDADNSIQRLM